MRLLKLWLEQATELLFMWPRVGEAGEKSLHSWRGWYLQLHFTQNLKLQEIPLHTPNSYVTASLAPSHPLESSELKELGEAQLLDVEGLARESSRNVRKESAGECVSILVFERNVFGRLVTRPEEIDMSEPSGFFFFLRGELRICTLLMIAGLEHRGHFLMRPLWDWAT